MTIFIFYDVSFTWQEILPWFIAQISIGQFYNPDFLQGYGVGVLNGSLWTIPVELQFYIGLPIIYWVFRKLNWNLIGVLTIFVALIVVNRLYAGVLSTSAEANLPQKLFGVTVFPYLFMFLIGVILQKNLNFVERFLFRKAHLWLGAYLVSAWLLTRFGLEVREISGNLLYPVSAILLGALAISAAYSNFGKLTRWLNRNDLSYGIYIYHMIVVNVFIQIGYVGNAYYFILAVVITFVFAMLSWVLVEKPSLRLKRYTIHRFGTASLGR